MCEFRVDLSGLGSGWCSCTARSPPEVWSGSSSARSRSRGASGLPVDGVADASFPPLVVSGDHNPALTAIAEELAQRLHAEHTVVEGAGHEMQTVAEDFNAALLRLWRRAK